MILPSFLLTVFLLNSCIVVRATSAMCAPHKNCELQKSISTCTKKARIDDYGQTCSYNRIGSCITGNLFNPFQYTTDQSLSAWDVSSVTSMDCMFAYAKSFNQDLSKWHVSSVTSMGSMFICAFKFNQDLSPWDVSAVTTVQFMFARAEVFNQDLSSWDVSAVKNMTWMFIGAYSFHQTLCGAAWVNSKAIQTDMFTGSHGWISSTVCSTTTSAKTPLPILTSTVTATAAERTTDATNEVGTAATTITPAFFTNITNTVVVVSVIAVFTLTCTLVLMEIRTRAKKRSIDKSLTKSLLNSAPRALITTDSYTVFSLEMPQADVSLTSAKVTTSTTDPVETDISCTSSEGTTSIINLSEADRTTISSKSATSSHNPTVTDANSSMIALTERTFATSNYKRSYAQAVAAPSHSSLLGAIDKILKLYANRIHVDERSTSVDTMDSSSHSSAGYSSHGSTCSSSSSDYSSHSYSGRCEDVLNSDVMDVVQEISRQIFAHGEDAEYDVRAMAEHLWTSSKKHRVVKGMELCSVLNAVIRDDVAEEIEAAAPIFRSMNSRRVRRGNVAANINVQSYPSNGETWRGGGFRRQYRAFFERMIGQKYRVPGYLATSDDRQIAVAFAFKASTVHPSHPCAVWRITFDARGELNPEYRVKHMTFVSKTLTAGENEYLFAPYSVFTLMSVKWSETFEASPHLFTIHAALDNKAEDEYLPLAPWY